MACVTFEGIAKCYKGKKEDVHAVVDLCLAIPDRELVVLVGPSGCGKTTTLRLVAGLEQADAGTIRIGDRIVNDVAPKDRDIAMVFQNYALYPHMTVFKNMAFGLKMRRTPRREIEVRVREVAGMLRIEHLLDRKPAALSGGERQRVAVGRAVVRRPRVFLFDEPLSNLDAKLRLHMRTEIKSLHHKLDTTIIYVTHDQEEAMTLGDRLVIMNHGVVHQRGAPLDIYNHPVDRFVAGFVGTPPMNFLEGCIEGDGADVFFVGSAGRLHVTPADAEILRSHIGRPVSLGIRPAHLHLAGTSPRGGGSATAGAANGTSLRASVTVAEPLGDFINVHLVTLGGESIVARVPSDVAVSYGQEARLDVDMPGVHVFAADAEARCLTLRDAICPTPG